MKGQLARAISYYCFLTFCVVGVASGETSTFDSVLASGDSEAQHALATEYYSEGGKQNFDRTAKLWEKAANKGHAASQVNLGILYELGQGVEANTLTAIKWYEKAAAQNNLQAQLALASVYVRGNGVPSDLKQAMKWFEAAAALGSAEAQFNLGQYYFLGPELPNNPAVLDRKKAMEFFEQAAEQGYANAATNLGAIYMGVNKTIRWRPPQNRVAS